MTARIAPTNAAAPMTANNFLLSFFFAALPISAAQATQTAAATSAMPSVSHSQVAIGVGFILLNLVWQLFRNFGLGLGLSAEDPVKLAIKSILFIFLALFADQIMVLVLGIVGTPYDWVVDTALPPIEFASFASVVTVLVGSLVSGSVSLIVLILVLIVAWNYIKLLFEAAERYILVGVLIYTAPVAFATGASENTSNVFSAWCRMLGGQLFLLIMNAWCLRLFTSMVGSFLANPLSV